MTWFKQPVGRVAQLSGADPGRLLLTSNEKFGERSLLISLAYADQGGNEFHLSLSADPKLSGLVYKQNLSEPAWDVSDVAQIELGLGEFTIDADGPKHGTVVVDESGARLIGCNNHQDRGWFDLDTWKHAKPNGVYRVSFPKWKLVAPNDRGDATVLFEWPPKKPAAG